MNAANVSARLRTLGFNPLGSGTSRNREGIRVTTRWDGMVRVGVDLDSPAAAKRLSADAEAALIESGLQVDRLAPEVFYVVSS